MAATQLHRDRLDFDDGAVVEMVIWQVPSPVAGSRHRYKYRLYYGRDGRRIVGYDNERGKGDHRHGRGGEERYRFTTVDQLVRDFLADVAKERES
jgi:hypothetical protein